MRKDEKERVVSELTERLKSSETLLVADYRGLTMPQIDALRGRLLEHGARFSVVKNTLTRRAAEEAGADALLALLEGPTAIAFLESGGDSVAVAKALRDVARDTRVLAIRGGVLEGRAVTAEEVESLATLPPADVLRGQAVGTIAAPLIMIVGLFTAPLRDLVAVLDARIDQLRGQGDTGETASAVAESAESEAQGGGAVEEERESGEGDEPMEGTPPDETQAEDTQDAPEEEGES